MVYRLGIANSRKQARQLVLHGHITVNGKKVAYPHITNVGGHCSKAKSASGIDHFKALREG